ncbi:hypothetical protein ADUPG1_006375 [Aduncisulcus paluster]|uniref:Uncharacterized protein n=1 Tax=Aduncisulcus paluster TaxID=2918883 RepID=A0ABQ5KI21_9EUKA|nr:hypothetical protein ADUPG1_006375 [Aduncisulcus paluster]
MDGLGHDPFASRIKEAIIFDEIFEFRQIFPPSKYLPLSQSSPRPRDSRKDAIHSESIKSQVHPSKPNPRKGSKSIIHFLTENIVFFLVMWRLIPSGVRREVNAKDYFQSVDSLVCPLPTENHITARKLQKCRYIHNKKGCPKKMGKMVVSVCDVIEEVCRESHVVSFEATPHFAEAFVEKVIPKLKPPIFPQMPSLQTISGRL